MKYCLEQNSCPNEVEFELGMTHPNGRHHKECQAKALMSSSHFDFLNRMDEATNMFNQTLFVTTKDSAINVTSVLDYACSGFFANRNAIAADMVSHDTFTFIKYPYTLTSGHYNYSRKVDARNPIHS